MIEAIIVGTLSPKYLKLVMGCSNFDMVLATGSGHHYPQDLHKKSIEVFSNNAFF
jgi:hypothetical protein